MICPQKTVRYEVMITPAGYITCTALQQAKQPFDSAMTNEIESAIESALQGFYIGGYVQAEGDDVWVLDDEAA